MRTGRYLCFILVTLLITDTVLAESPEDEAVTLLKAYLKVDTINPPGNESRAVDFYSRIFDAEGIKWHSAESAPGRGNIWARLKGGDKPAIVLIQHTDVVPADENYWTVDPLSGEEKDGYIWGRGAIDMKGIGIVQLATFLRLHRQNMKLNRDVVFVASADEEAGGQFGAGWLIEHHPEIFAGAGLLLNEGGFGTDINGDRIFIVEITQKVPVWLRLSVSDTPGHGSMPLATSAMTRIVEALNRLRVSPFPARIIPTVDAMFKGLATSMEDEWSDAYSDMATAVQAPDFLPALQARSPLYHALTRDTCSITRMGASDKINVVAPQAWAEIDCRMLPDRSSAEFIADVEALLAGTGVRLETILAFTPAVSTTDTDLFRAIENVAAKNHPGSRVIPGATPGFTDSHFFRDLGIVSYGFTGIVTPMSEFVRVHGNDERVSTEAIRDAVRDFFDVVSEVVYE